MELKKNSPMTTSELFPPTPGDRKGRCVVCGRETDRGHKIDFSSNFTAWNLLEEGDVICEYCYTLARDQQYRRKSWVATMEGVRFITRKEVLDVLLNPPEPPFAIYITKSGKKQGFFHIINRLNYSRERFYIAFEDSLVFIDRAELEKMVEIARRARELGFSKSELRGDIKVRHFEHRELAEHIMSLSGNPVWEVVVFAVE